MNYYYPSYSIVQQNLYPFGAIPYYGITNLPAIWTPFTPAWIPQTAFAESSEQCRLNCMIKYNDFSKCHTLCD